MPAGLPEETMGATHPEENNKSGMSTTSSMKPNTALLHLQAALEAAQESGTDIYMPSWDIKRVYGSPSKTDIKLAWIRLGISPNIAD